MEIVAADIGGTHARFAIAGVEAGRVVGLSEPVTLKTAEYASLQTAWEAFGATLGRPLPRVAGIAIAAPITGDVIRMTNNPWIVRPALVDAKLGLDHHVLINDFAAVAHAVAAVDPEHFVHLAGPDAALPSPRCSARTAATTCWRPKAVTSTSRRSTVSRTAFSRTCAGATRAFRSNASWRGLGLPPSMRCLPRSRAAPSPHGMTRRCGRPRSTAATALPPLRSTASV
jgi:predicted NBD/HSP70 family sugar kinase